MYCKKCGTEQCEGQKFCPKCGTPFLEMEQSAIESKSSSSKDLPLKEKYVKEEWQKEEEIVSPVQNEQVQEQKQESQSESCDIQTLSPSEEKKILRYAKAGMWIIVAAIVLTFARAGFGFSFWWYVYLIIFAIVAMCLWGMTLPDSNDKVKTFDSNDVSAIKIVSCIGAIMLVILYLCGPLNSNYTISHSEERRNSSESYEQSMNDSYKQLETSFSNEQDVRMYLCSHRFASNDGYTLSFSNNANEVSLNGQQLSSYVEIRSVSSSSAVVRAQGPYGNTTFRLSVSGSGGVIEDTNDGGMYYSK